MPPEGRQFYVIVRNENDDHWTSHSDFVDGKFYGDLASANAALAALSAQPKTCLQAAGLRPPHGARTSSASSASTSGSGSADESGSEHDAAEPVSSGRSRDGRCSCGYKDGVRYEVRKIATRSLCGRITWWFADDEAAS
ncbi:uncharacterized protein PV09_05768 [Verruconis gallopava]|uniref:Uncharacterized protein n=1 Tax=Verruconis gallopava TaxID=253628 RepID=A0A0D2A983_9PEZI|nr:uncharacterized protein PV09_05768 [Verruconis gallopava]KIW03125.1 hypothetical protein PV09_05768 [Verruconis gallopava]